MLRKPWLKSAVTPQQTDLVGMLMDQFQASVPDMLNLTGDDKAICLKGGLPQLAMMQQIKRIYDQDPDLLPRYIDPTIFESTLDSVEQLLVMKDYFTSALEAVESTLTAAKDDGMYMCLEYYHSLKRASKSAKPGLRKKYMEVRENFIHETGQTPEEQFPEKTDGGGTTPTDGGGNAPA